VSEAADPSGSIDLSARLRSYESVQAVLSNDRNRERRIAATRNVIAEVLAQAGVDGLAEVAVELSLKLAAALERIACTQGIGAVDLAEIWFVD
jgi:hypothetical protein